MDGLLLGKTAYVSSLGIPVSPAQYLRDLRALAVLLQLADHRPSATALPKDLTDALDRHVATRRERRASRSSKDKSDRTWTAPPRDTRVLAALLHESAAILALPTPEDAREVLPPLVAGAKEREAFVWSRIRSAAQPSDALFRYFSPKRAGTFSVHMLRAACPTALTITSDHIPAYLDEERYQRWFTTFAPSEQRNIRRAVPIAIVQLVEDCALHTAADRLGIPRVSAQAALIRAGRACKGTNRDDEFRRLIGLTAEDLQAHPIDYGHRRRHLNASWDIPQSDWEQLVETMLTARLARKDTSWGLRRTALRIWVWSHVTGGDPALAPMVQDTSMPRRSTHQAISAYSTLRRRAAPALEEIIADYATDLAHRIDAQPSDAPAPSAVGISSDAPDCTAA